MKSLNFSRELRPAACSFSMFCTCSRVVCVMNSCDNFFSAKFLFESCRFGRSVSDTIVDETEAPSFVVLDWLALVVRLGVWRSAVCVCDDSDPSACFQHSRSALACSLIGSYFFDDLLVVWVRCRCFDQVRHCSVKLALFQVLFGYFDSHQGLDYL